MGPLGRRRFGDVDLAKGDAAGAGHVDGLCVTYGRSQVLFDVALDVPAIGAVAVLGRNGVGKTTLLKSIIGELPAMLGTTRFNGRDVTRLPTEQRVRLGLGFVPQEHLVFARLSVRENLALGSLGRRDDRARRDVLEIFPKLAQRPSGISPRARCQAVSARCWPSPGRLLLKPRLLLLDEPTVSGLGPSKKSPSD